MALYNYFAWLPSPLPNCFESPGLGADVGAGKKFGEQMRAKGAVSLRGCDVQCEHV